MLSSYLKSSIGKKQIVAVSGLVLISFVVAHLAGNLTFYFGPETFNGYAAKLKNLRPLLNVFEAGLLAIFITHLVITALLVRQNSRGRENCYAVFVGSGKQTFSSRTMRFTGPIILVYIILHLLDYTLTEHYGLASVVRGQNLGLYGLVYNSFLSIGHSLWYAIAMVAVGLHLDHGVQSFFQTFGLCNKNYAPLIKKASRIFAIVITAGYVSIPAYVYFVSQCSSCTLKAGG